MEDKRNAYEIVGTNKVAIDRIKDELEKDDFIKEKALETIKRISRKIEIEKQKLEAISSLSEKILINRKIEKAEKEIEDIQKITNMNESQNNIQNNMQNSIQNNNEDKKIGL